MWAYMLITMYLSQVDAIVNFGNKQSVFQTLMLENINSIEADDFLEKEFWLMVVAPLSLMKACILQ